MSTILDALRKLQRERAAANPPRDLRGSITDHMPAPRARARSSRRGLALGGVVLVVLAAGAGTWLYRSGKVAAWRHASPTQMAAATPAAPDAAAPDAANDPRAFPDSGTEDQLEKADLEREMALERAMGQHPAEPETPAAVGAPPAPLPSPDGPPPANPAAEADAERARLEAAQAQALAAANAQRQAEEEAAAARAAEAAPPPPPAPEVTPEIQAAAAPTLAPPPAPAPAKAAAPTPKPAAPKPKAKPKAKPAPPVPRVVEPDAYSAANDTASPGAFPAVRVESIRWHPLAERRVASLRFEQQNVADAHEGDVVAGVLVFRIDPGAVELRIGSTSRVIRPAP